MRLSIVALLLIGCGNWSNEDIEYLYALPQKDMLKSQLGAMGNTAQGPLSVGDPSDTYDKTKKTSEDFNKLLDGVLTGLDFIRSIPPTRRLDNARFWGPYKDDKNPGFEVQIEIHREDLGANYNWAIKMRPIGGDFTTVGGGGFKPTESLRKGQGTFFFDGKASRALLNNGKPDDPDRIEFGYATDTDPVNVVIKILVAGAKELDIASNAYADKHAVLSFEGSDPSNPDASRVHYDVNWDSSTAGRANYKVLEGNFVSYGATECWGSEHTLVYAKQDWPGGMSVGDPNDCIAEQVLKPLPP